jgi:DNA adenine methylase
MSIQPVRPVKPVAPYVGGKFHLAKRICAIIDATHHTIYAEPFVGMGGIFLRRTRQPRIEVINDISRDVTTLFRILQRHFPQFMETLRFQITSRAEFERLVAINPNTLTDLERAARFLYLQRTAYGGKQKTLHFGVSRDRPARFDLTRVAPLLDDVHTRLSGVTIECLTWDHFIPRYDGDDTLFYLDPPYWGCEDYYGKAIFARDDFARLATVLAGIDGKFILSLNDVPEVRALFAAFSIEAVSTSYSVSTGKAKQAAEVIIRNF